MEGGEAQSAEVIGALVAHTHGPVLARLDLGGTLAAGTDSQSVFTHQDIFGLQKNRQIIQYLFYKHKILIYNINTQPALYLSQVILKTRPVYCVETAMAKRPLFLNQVKPYPQ